MHFWSKMHRYELRALEPTPQNASEDLVRDMTKSTLGIVRLHPSRSERQPDRRHYHRCLRALSVLISGEGARHYARLPADPRQSVGQI